MAHAGGAQGAATTIPMITAQDAHAMYKALGQLGEGAFSEVFRVENKKTNKISAMKRFKKKFETQKEVDSLREIQALRRLNPHPHIVILEQVIFDPRSGILCLTFEVMENNLYTILARKGQIIPEPLVKKYFYQVCKGLEYMHSKGIFHRDIKPENILVREIDGVVKIADFGSCRGIHSKAPYTEYIATRWYRSPECLLCKGLYNYKLDIWGAGCVLYEVITKHPLFPGKNEMDQLQKIHNIMGSPTQKQLKKIGGALGFRINYNFPHQEGTGLVGLNGKCSPECVSLVQALLMYDPEERITAKLAVRHPWFAEFNPAPAPVVPAITEVAVQPITTTAAPVQPTTEIRQKIPMPLTLALSPDMIHQPEMQPNSGLKEVSPGIHASLNSLALGASPINGQYLVPKAQELYSPSSLMAAENANKKRRSNMDLAQALHLNAPQSNEHLAKGGPSLSYMAGGASLVHLDRSVHASHRSLVIPEASVLNPNKRASVQNVHLSPSVANLTAASQHHLAATSLERLAAQPVVAAPIQVTLPAQQPLAAAIQAPTHVSPVHAAEPPTVHAHTHSRRRSIVDNVLGVFGRQSHMNRNVSNARQRKPAEKRTTMILPQIQPLWRKLAPVSHTTQQADHPMAINEEAHHRHVEPLPKTNGATRKPTLHLPKLGSPDSQRTMRREEHTGK